MLLTWNKKHFSSYLKGFLQNKQNNFFLSCDSDSNIINRKPIPTLSVRDSCRFDATISSTCIEVIICLISSSDIPAKLPKHNQSLVSNKNTGKMCETCSKSRRHSGVFIVNSEHISQLFIFLVLTLSR